MNESYIARSRLAYPPPGRALLPAALRPYMGSRPLRAPSALREAAGLQEDVVLKDLSADLWDRLEPEMMTQLAAQVAKAVHAGMYARQLHEARERIFDPAVPLALLRIGSRARNILFHARAVREGLVGPIELRDLARARNLGGVSLLQLLAAAEEARPSAAELAENSGGPAGPGTRRTLSRTVRREAKKLAGKRWARRIRREDLRVGPALGALDPSSLTPFAAAGVLPDALYEPGEARVKVGMIRRFVERVDRMGRLTLEGELDDMLVAFTRREHQRIALRRRFGWDGSPPATLEEAANEVGLTRERVRQLEVKFANAIRHAWTPALDRTLRVVQEKPFARLVDVQVALRDAKLIDRDFPMTSLLATARLFGRDMPALSVYGGMIGPPDFLATATKVEQMARRLTSYWGATTVAELTSVISEGGTTLTEDVARHALELVPGTQFLDPERQWLWIPDTARNRLLNNVLKVMSVAGSIDLEELRDGIGRHHRSRGFRPPRSVLARICSESGRYEVRDGRAIGKAGLPEWRDVLAANERLIATALFEHGPVMRRTDLEDLVVGSYGMKRNSFYIYLTYSPILERYAPGVFGLRGARTSAAEISAMIPPLRRSQVLRDHGWTPDRRIWIVYRLSPGARSTGVLTVPAALAPLLRGQFELTTDDRTVVGSITIEDAKLWGLSGFFRRRGVEAGDHVLLTFTLGEGTARVEVGGSDVALRYEDEDYAARLGARVQV